jgi:hypothetical protein
MSMTGTASLVANDRPERRGCPRSNPRDAGRGELLQAFAAKFPELKPMVERSLDYRLCVEKEFCRLARRSAA